MFTVVIRGFEVITDQFQRMRSWRILKDNEINSLEKLVMCLKLSSEKQLSISPMLQHFLYNKGFIKNLVNFKELVVYIMQLLF